jgi:hypothetical protein
MFVRSWGFLDKHLVTECRDRCDSGIKALRQIAAKIGMNYMFVNVADDHPIGDRTPSESAALLPAVIEKIELRNNKRVRIVADKSSDLDLRMPAKEIK